MIAAKKNAYKLGPFGGSLAFCGALTALLLIALVAVAYFDLPAAIACTLYFVLAALVSHYTSPLGLSAMLIATLPFNALYLPELPLGLPISLLVTALCLITMRSSGAPQHWVPVRNALLAYFAVALSSFVIAYFDPNLTPPFTLPEELGARASRLRGLYTLLAIALPISVFYYTFRFLDRAERLRSVIWLWLGVTSIAAGFSIYEVAAKALHLPLVFFSFDAAEYVSQASLPLVGFNIPRAYGTAGEPGYFGTYMQCGITLTSSLLLNKTQGFARQALLTVLCLALAGEFLTFSLAGWAATIISLLVMTLASPSRRKVGRVFIAAQLMLFTTAALFLISPESVDAIVGIQVSRLADSFAGTTTASGVEDPRYAARKMGMDLFLDHPILGVGLGNEPFWLPLTEGKLATSGNVWSTSLSETGAIGTAALALVALSVLFSLFRFCQSSADVALRSIAAASFGAFTGLLISSASWGSRFSEWHWFIAAIGFGAMRLAPVASTRKQVPGQQVSPALSRVLYRI